MTTIPILQNSISFYSILFSLYVLLADILEQYKLYSMEFSTHNNIESWTQSETKQLLFVKWLHVFFTLNYVHIS